MRLSITEPKASLQPHLHTFEGYEPLTHNMLWRGTRLGYSVLWRTMLSRCQLRISQQGDYRIKSITILGQRLHRQYCWASPPPWSLMSSQNMRQVTRELLDTMSCRLIFFTFDLIGPDKLGSFEGKKPLKPNSKSASESSVFFLFKIFNLFWPNPS